MDEFENLNSQQETEEGTGVVTGEEAETAPEESVPEEGNTAEVASGTKAKQSRKENNRYAEARRAGHDEGAKAERERINRMLARQGIPDPTAEGKTLDSIEALENYGVTLRAQNRNVDPEVIREEDQVRDWKEAKDAEETEKAEHEAVEKDLADFREKYPEVDLEELAKNERFSIFAEGRIEKESMASIYAKYCKLMEGVDVKPRGDKNERSTGAGSGDTSRLTASQKRTLEKWNRDNPDMKMDEEEFMRR